MSTAENPRPQEDKEMTTREAAIRTVRDCVVEALEEEKWCQAKQYGDALEILVGLTGPPTLVESPEEGLMVESQERR